MTVKKMMVKKASRLSLPDGKCVFSETWDVTVCLQAGEGDVEEPQANEERGREDLDGFGSTQLSAHRRAAPQHEHAHVDEGADGEERDGKGQRTRLHMESLTFDLPVDGRDGPGHADPQKDVHGVAACHVSHRSVGVLILNRRDFTRKGICERTMRAKEE